MKFSALLAYFSIFSVCIPLVTGIVFYRNFTLRARYLFYIIIVSAVSEAIGLIYSAKHMQNLFVIRAYTIIEFILYSLFFLTIFTNRKIKVVIKSVIVIFLGIATFDFYMNGISKMDDICSTFEFITLMLYALSAFYFLISNPIYLNILSEPLFWFLTAILIYFAGTLFLFVFSNYLEKYDPGSSENLWVINSVLNLLFYLLISTGFWKTRTT